MASDGAPQADPLLPSSSSSRDSRMASRLQNATSLTIRALQEMTDDFSEQRKIGQGAYGKVYVAKLENGEEIAVKMLYNNMPGIDDVQFQREFEFLMRLEHENIVRLVGYCYETQHQPMQYMGRTIFAERTYRALCFEYMQNGSLEKHISDECDGLDWLTRYKIIKGTCDGLNHLHEGFGEPIYHLDLKPDNILLDKNMVPKLADFGLSKLFGDKRTMTTHSPIGTIGYLPMEFLHGNIISNKFDIFSLGVVMIKIIAGHGGYSRSAEMPRQEFLDLVHENWRNRMLKTCQVSLPLEAYYEQVNICTDIALSCMEIDRHKRPKITEIVHRLNETEAVIDKVLEREKIMQPFQDITSRLEQGLAGISFDELGISDEVREHVNHLDSRASFVSTVKKFKDFMQIQDPVIGIAESTTNLSSNVNSTFPVVPDDFRCPISLDLMKDPVIVSTGQTYERGCIERWLEAGHDTCPKMQQKLLNKSLTPNVVLRSLIAQWCKANGVEPPKRPAQLRNAPGICAASEHSKVIELLQKLSSQNLVDQRGAAGMLRQLAKRGAENRACIGDAGVIPILVSLLPTTDVSTQEHVVTALLNLSIYEENKARIMTSGAVPGIVHVLKRGSMEARENSAATLFSLSVLDENKVMIGATEAIPALVVLLVNGSERGKKDAAAALFNLCIYQGNKSRAISAGIVPILLELVPETESGMVDEALAIMAILSSHPEGKAAISSAAPIPILVGVIKTGSARNKENAAAVLVHLCNGEDQQQDLAEAHEQGIVTLLEELAESGTDRGKRKAIQLLERMNRFLQQQSQA